MSRNLLRVIVLIVVLSISLFRFLKKDEPAGLALGRFDFEKGVTLPGTPEWVFDQATGDISGWWDHSFSENPARLYIEPRPGGGFYELFDDSGDGVLHATVIAAQRGKLLRFDGPLGFSGKALQLVCTYTFAPLGSDSTAMTLTVHGAGEMEAGTPDLIEKVWHHFLFERFQPYVERRAGAL